MAIKRNDSLCGLSVMSRAMGDEIRRTSSLYSSLFKGSPFSIFRFNTKPKDFGSRYLEKSNLTDFSVFLTVDASLLFFSETVSKKTKYNK